jgi:hypothetical protein
VFLPVLNPDIENFPDVTSSEVYSFKVAVAMAADEMRPPVDPVPNNLREVI